MLNVDATVRGNANDFSPNWGWVSGPSSGSITGGSTSSGGGDGSASGVGSSSTTTFVPYNAPKDSVATGLSTTGALTKGQIYNSPSGATYVWDGKSWCVAIAEVEVKGQRPANPADGQYHIYVDPQFGYTTVYEYISGRWTIPMFVGVIEDPFGTNSCELGYIASNPLIAAPLQTNKAIVEAFMDQYFPMGNLDGDSPHNAIKHALYQALNTCSIGTTHTRAMAIRHEECDGKRPSSDASFNMDTFNNNVGITIGNNWQEYGCDRANLVAAVLEAFQRGQLHKIDGNPTP